MKITKLIKAVPFDGVFLLIILFAISFTYKLSYGIRDSSSSSEEKRFCRFVANGSVSDPNMLYKRQCAAKKL